MPPCSAPALLISSLLAPVAFAAKSTALSATLPATFLTMPAPGASFTNLFLAFLNCLNPVAGSSLTAPSDQSVPVHVQVAVPSLYALPGFKSSIDLGSLVGCLSNVFAP